MKEFDPYEIHSVVNGSVRLDGGAMFGVVPRVMWEKKAPPDDRHRIHLATRTLLAIDRSAGRIILVDTGCGTKWSDEMADRFGVVYDPEAIPKALANAGARPEDVTDVVLSHLHFDHNGGITRWANEPGGTVQLVYPGAKHWVHERHLAHALAPSPKDRGSFIADDFECLVGTDRLAIVTGDEAQEAEIPGVTWHISHGHTPFHMHPEFGTGDDRLLFAGDIIPTTNHLPLAWVMAYDIEPLRTIERKREFIGRAIRDNVIVAFPHDPDVAAARLGGDQRKPTVTPSLQ